MRGRCPSKRSTVLGLLSLRDRSPSSSNVSAIAADMSPVCITFIA